jgi:hypothetical protein
LKAYELTIEDWQWIGNHWNNQPSQGFAIKGDRANLFVSAGLTSTGWVSALVSADYLDLNGEQQSQIVGAGRQSEVSVPAAEPFSASVKILPVPTPQPTEVVVGQPNDQSISSGSFSISQYRNLIGIVLVATILFLGFYYYRRRAGSKS